MNLLKLLLEEKEEIKNNINKIDKSKPAIIFFDFK